MDGINGWMNGWINGWMDERMDAQMERQRDGWMDEKVRPHNVCTVKISFSILKILRCLEF